MSTAWARAYLEQARSDRRLFDLLVSEAYCDSVEHCHALHYLQMTCEKLGKAGLLAARHMTREEARHTHAAFARYMGTMKRNHSLARLMEMNPKDLAEHIGEFDGLVHSIERLAPAEAGDDPNPEYPWSDGIEVRSPARYRFDVWDRMEKDGVRLYKMLQVILDHFETLNYMQPAGN